ncbi:LysE family translocator [Thaumasiovibrio subtropicus]|uniref:LysE family translocator n=1 Tax=Thaumasiovibrio subtropicus TaxID=1891207 RepID=UPI000B3557FD|nr:LysE family translocator [Thaumasiovibrio subtropicus]
MSLEFLMMFTTTVFVVSIIPGPSMLLALTHGMSYGVKRAAFSGLGNISATMCQAIISVIGLGAVLAASETAFMIIKWGGAAYLVYMGYSMLKAARLSGGADVQVSREPVTATRLFVQGVLVTAGNPKAIVFFSAVFPQFLDTSQGVWLQSTVMIAICMAVSFFCFMLYAVCGKKIVSLFSSSSAGKFLKRLIGSTFIGSGIALAASQR